MFGEDSAATLSFSAMSDTVPSCWLENNYLYHQYIVRLCGSLLELYLKTGKLVNKFGKKSK